jgi:ribosome recycling factor
MNILDLNKEEFNGAIAHLKQDISSLRTGRATPALVEDIFVECYGGHQPVKALGSIMVSDPKTLVVEPWDKSLMQAVEVAIRNASIGVNPVNDGKVIRIPLPQLTQERRQELIKVLHGKLEQARISLRKIREDVKGMIDDAEKDGTVAEDEKFKQYDLLDKLVKDLNENIKKIGEEKEKEINTI